MAVRKTKAGLRLKRWFKEDWRTPRGKKDYRGGENTFRPTKRITKDTPSTWSELSKGEKRRAKMEKDTKGRVSRYKKKKGSKKFFLGGLMKGIASITPIGITAKLIKGKRDEARKQKEADEMQGGGKGKLMTVKVVSGGGSKNDGELQDKINEKKEAQSSDDGSVKSGVTAGIMKKGGKVKLKKKPRPFKKSGVRANKKDDDDKKINAVIVNEDDVKNKTIYGPRNGGSCPEPFDINCPEDRKKMSKDILDSMEAEENWNNDKDKKKKPINPKSYEDGGKPEIKIDKPEKPDKPDKPEKLDSNNVSIHKNKDKDAQSDTIGDFTKRNVKGELATQGISHGSRMAVRRGAPKAVGKVGGRFVPGVGYGLLAADTGKLMMEQKAKGYAKLDAKSPGTSKHLETGAYGNQTSDSGHKVRGTFFGSMKEKGGVVKKKTKKYRYGGKVNEGEISKKKKRKHIKSTNKNYAKSLEYDILSNSGVLYSREGTRKMKRVLKAKEESLYRKTGKKPPKRNMF